MMNVRELRIGNYVIDNLEICQVIEFEANGIVMTTCKSKFPISHINELQSVELTEDLLLKCGFDENMVLSTIEGEIRYYGDGDINIGGEDSCTLGMVYIAKCKYLHQLQNLYFALTGEDLKVDLQQTLLQETKTYNHGTNR